MRRPFVLVLRGRDAFSDKLRESGCEVINLELIKTEAVKDLAELDRNLASAEDLDGLIFTSPTAAAIFLGHTRRSGIQIGGKIYVLGQRTKTVFENAGIRIECREKANTAAEMIACFGDAEFAGKRLLFVRGDKSMRTIPELLGGIAEVAEAVVYRTVETAPDSKTAARLTEGKIDWVCFFSPSAVDVFQRIFGPGGLIGVKMAAIGNTTARKARELGLEIDLISERAHADDFASAVIGRITNSFE